MSANVARIEANNSICDCEKERFCEVTRFQLSFTDQIFQIVLRMNLSRIFNNVKLIVTVRPLCGFTGNLAFLITAMEHLPFQIVANGFLAVESFFFIRFV